MARTRTGSGVTKRRAGRLAARTAFWREATARPARLRAAAVSRAPAAACFGRAALRARPGAERTRGFCGSFAPALLRRARGDRRGIAWERNGGPRRWPAPGRCYLTTTALGQAPAEKRTPRDLDRAAFVFVLSGVTPQNPHATPKRRPIP